MREFQAEWKAIILLIFFTIVLQLYYICMDGPIYFMQKLHF